VSRRLLLLPLLAIGLVACSESAPNTSNAPQDPASTDVGTLLPVLTDPNVPDTTIPPDALFGGDVCMALDANDVASTSFRGVGRAPLTATNSPSPDSCEYTVGSGTNTASVLVQMISPDDFATPPASNEIVETISGLGLAARSINHGDTVEVQVQVTNGFFSVTTADLASARRLAERAVPRATPGATP
jgi:hypothetical protein